MKRKYLIMMGIALLVISSLTFRRSNPRRDLHKEAAFSNYENFRSQPSDLEPVTKVQGTAYLNFICANYPELLGHLELFRSSDAIGNPLIHDFGSFGRFSPTTLRFIKIAGDLKKHFGSLQELKIVEIGAGYGGQCKILMDLFFCKEYTIVDIPEALALAKRFLNQNGIHHVNFVPIDKIDTKQSYDLILRTNASPSIEGWKDLLNTSKKGYLIFEESALEEISPYLDSATKIPSESLPTEKEQLFYFWKKG